MTGEAPKLDLFQRLAAWRLTARYYAEGNPVAPPSRAEWLDLADTLVELFELMEEGDVDELTMRVGSVERELAGVRGDIAILHHRVDNLDRRMARIERRLELGALEERE